MPIEVIPNHLRSQVQEPHLCYTCRMAGEQKSWYRKPWGVVALVAAAILLLILVPLIWQTVHYIALIKSGKLSSPEEQKKAEFRQQVDQALKLHPPTALQSKTIEGGKNPTWGNPQAALRITEFMDYDCPYCQAIDPAIMDFMSQHATDTLLILRDFPVAELHPQAEEAALAARCAWTLKPDGFWDFHRALFAQQGEHSLDGYVADAVRIGIPDQDFRDCYQNQTPIQDMRQSLSDGEHAGVAGTPTFFFNGVKLPVPDESYLEIISQEVRAAK